MALLLAVDTVPVAARSSAGRVQVRIRRCGDAVRRFRVEGPITAFADLETFFVLLVCVGKLSPPSVDGVDNFCLSLLRVVIYHCTGWHSLAA